ncbi:MAG TPA: LuxR C-terminal-related transcriptional regulator [Methylomirabilota bacterium]|jgi:PAS domain S-box-containing protein|nr:LuxR C-terminal-related transcriptional regulator [Methylomirabilota bacterium]
MSKLDANGLDQALARAGDGAFAIGADGKILTWNRAAEKILGHAAREVIGRSCCDVLAARDDDDNRLCHQGCRVMALLGMGESVQSFDMRTHRKSGEAIWINASVLALPNGRPAGLLTVYLFRDVTASKELLRLVHERLAAAGGPDGAQALSTLTRRELEILRLISAGVKTTDAAERLHVSRATVRNHVQNILVKLGVHSRLEAMAYATRHRLL